MRAGAWLQRGKEPYIKQHHLQKAVFTSPSSLCTRTCIRAHTHTHTPPPSPPPHSERTRLPLQSVLHGQMFWVGEKACVEKASQLVTGLRLWLGRAGMLSFTGIIHSDHSSLGRKRFMSAHTTIIEETHGRNLNIDSPDSWPDMPTGHSLN